MVKFPSDLSESTMWGKLIGATNILPSSRVSIIHFFEVDILVKSDADGNSTFDSIDRYGPTKYQLSDTGNFSLTSPSRPAAPKSHIENSIFFGTRLLKYSDFLVHAASWSSVKKSSNLKRKENKAMAAMESIASPPADNFSKFFDANSDNMKAGRQHEIPFHENYIGTSLKTVSLIKSIHNHGKNCQGNIFIRRSGVFLKRLSLQVTINCSEKSNCAIWEKGIFKWISSGTIKIPNTNRVAQVPDVLYSLACYITPTTKAHAEQFFSTMLLTPPSRNMLNDLVKSFVKPYLIQEKEKIISNRCEEIRALKEGIIVNMDVGYTGARKAQCATIMVGSGSRALFSRTDTENGAWLKEGLLVSIALNEAINERKLDIVAVEIDDNAANKKKIENCKRINGPIEFRQETVKGLNDVFHAAKSMGRQAIKIVSLFTQQLESKIKPLTVSHGSNWDFEGELLIPILSSLESNFQLYFNDINEKFEHIGANEWVQASTSATGMQELAVILKLVDETINHEYWAPIVEVWNKHKPPSATDAENISTIIITKTTSLRCLTAIANAVCKLVEVNEQSEVTKNNIIGYLKLHLPSICFRGDNFSVNFMECLDNCITNIKSNNRGTSQNEEKRIEIIREIFGTKNPSNSEIKKLKTDKIIKLAQYLEFDLPSPIHKQDVKKAKEHCAKNIWHLQGLWDDIDAAISIAHRSFSARIGEYKKLMKTLIRVVNETYGMWSIRFKMNFVLNGLLNFSQHFCNDHSSCSRYIWWTQCSNAHLNQYLPAQEYVSDLASGRGLRCNTYIPLFFRILVKAFTLSPYLEGLLSKCILYSKTTICESYFHWLGIMVPKWQNVTKFEYILRESAAYIAFCKRQDDKCLFTKKLRQHKYASTLVGTAGQKNGRYERYILEAVMEIVGDDKASVNTITHLLQKLRVRLENRNERLTKLNETYEQDITAQNLKMGPVRHEFRTAGGDGVLSGKQLQESTHSAKPVPPFPFLKQDLLTNESDKKRLNDIWDWTKSISFKKKDIALAQMKCAICEEIIALSDLLQRCFNCKTAVHESCLSTQNTGWTDEENLYCEQCVIFSHLNLDTSI